MGRNKLTVLITGVGAMGVGEGIIKCLKMKTDKYRIIATNMDHNAPMLYVVDKGYIVPPSSSETYLYELMSICKKENVDMLIPGSEAELQVIADNRPHFEDENIFLLINSQKTIDIGNNKWETFKFLTKNGFNTPNSTLAIKNQSFFAKNDFPVIVKPLTGHGSANLFIAKTIKEMEFFSNFLKRNNIPHLFQEYIGKPDEEYTVGIISDYNGNIIQTIVMKRLLKNGFSQYVEIINDPLITESCEEIASKLGSVGPLNIQGRLYDNAFFVFEINPRFSGSAPFRALAGLNEPDILIDTILNGKIDVIEIKNLIGMRFLNEMFIEPTELNKNEINNSGTFGDYL